MSNKAAYTSVPIHEDGFDDLEAHPLATLSSSSARGAGRLRSPSPPLPELNPIPKFDGEDAAIQTPRILRQTVIRAGCVLGVMALVLYLLPYHPRMPQLTKTSIHPHTPSIRFSNLTQGRWVQSSMAYTQDDALRDYGSAVDDTVVEGYRGEALALKIASWRWQPAMETEMRQWDGYEFTKRLINSQIGMLLVGDSLTKQIALVLGGLGGGGGGMLRVTKEGYYSETNPEYYPAPFTYFENEEMPSTVVEIRLSNTSAWYEHIKKDLPHVPLSRLDQPFVTMIRHDTLVDLPRITELAHLVGQEPTFRREGKWAHLRQHDWLSYLDVLSSEPTWPGQENSVIVPNSGAHFTDEDLGMVGDGLAEVVKEIVHEVVTKLVAQPRLDVIFRSTAPGQPYCPDFVAPVYPAQVDLAHPDHPSWGWDQFGRHNDLWKAEMDVQAPAGRNKDGSGSVVYFDVSEMAGQRPDAHMIYDIKSPDCLHFAPPGVPSWWTRMLWHIMGSNDSN